MNKKKVEKKIVYSRFFKDKKYILYIFILCVKAFSSGKDRYNNDINYATYYVT